MSKFDAVFIDRDGTMGANSDVQYPQDFCPFPFTKEAVQLLRDAGIKTFIFSNQSCIARGKSNNYDFEGEFRSYGMDDWFVCPHDDADNCNCRKPKPGLLLEAQVKYNLDVSRCIVIGDRWSDMLCGAEIGTKIVLVLTGRGPRAMTTERVKWNDFTPNYIARDLLDAAKWIVYASKK